MPLFDLIALALIQGITEFLPISSSGHLALWPLLTGRPDQGVTIDVAVHLGTLVAVCLYFRSDIGRIFVGAGHLLRGRTTTSEARLALLLALATVPAIVVGLALKLTDTHDGLRTLAVIGWASLLGGVVLWVADRWGPETRESADWGVRDAILMGLAQAVALVPGASRAGMCMLAARALGFERSEAARIALLMAVPTILAAATVETAGLVADGDLRLGLDFAIGAVFAFAAALAALAVMMRMFRARWTMTPFVLYRVGLGIVLIALAA
ncbi:MAG: undecaprenyl-diphosphate phosphatase [Paracoccaceae bacterium]